MGRRPKNTVKNHCFEWPILHIFCSMLGKSVRPQNPGHVCAIDFGVKQVHPPKKIEHVHFLTIWVGLLLFYLFGDKKNVHPCCWTI